MSDESLRPRKKTVIAADMTGPVPSPDDESSTPSLHDDRDEPRPLKPIISLSQARLRLNLAHPEVQRDLQDCQGMHRRVMRLFQHVNATRDTNEILYRIDRQGVDWWMTIQSTADADITALPAGYALPPIRQRDDVWVHLQQVVTGQQFPFVLVANIVKRDFHERRTRTVYDPAEQRDWLRRKGAQHGFRVDEDTRALLPLEISTDPQVNGLHKNGKLSYDAFRISGSLTVVDPSLLANAVATGIGKAKAYGFGLLTLVGV